MRCSQNLAAARDCGEPSGKSAGLGSVGLWAPPFSVHLSSSDRNRVGFKWSSKIANKRRHQVLGLLAARDGCAREAGKRGVSDVALLKRLRNIEEWLRGLWSLAPLKSP